MPNHKLLISVDGVSLKLANLAKIFYPTTGFTKGQMIDYYIRIAPALLPHLSNRPVTMKRYPNGVAGKFFYQKECPHSRPSWLTTAPIQSNTKRSVINFCLIDTLPALVWAANLAALEIHTSLSLAHKISNPTMLVFDLDPGPPSTVIDCARVALWLKDFFDNFGLKSFPKTSGSKGLQIYVPLNTSSNYNQTKHFAHMLAKMLESQHPLHVVSKMTKKLRQGKVFIDWSQNDEHKTTVCVYSLRAREHPTVSAPVTWTEVTTAWQKQDPTLLVFTADKVLDRFQQVGDLFSPVLSLEQTLPQIN